MFFKTARAEVRRKERQSNEKFRPKASEGVFTLTTPEPQPGRKLRKASRCTSKQPLQTQPCTNTRKGVATAQRAPRWSSLLTWAFVVAPHDSISHGGHVVGKRFWGARPITTDWLLKQSAVVGDRVAPG